MRNFSFGAMTVLAMLVLGCADKPEPSKPVSTAKIVGRIASIPADRKFVLIQAYGKWEVANGTILVTRGPEDRSANLRVTGETLGQYAAADLQAGTVEVGDAVMTRPEVKAEPETAAQTSPAPSAQAPEAADGNPAAPAEPAPVDPKKKWPGEGWTDVAR